MIRIFVQYKVKKDKINLIKNAIKDFIQGVKNTEPNTLYYTSYQLENKQKFIHLMTFKDELSEEKHRKSQNTKKFVNVLYPNCEQEPIFYKLNLLASNR